MSPIASYIISNQLKKPISIQYLKKPIDFNNYKLNGLAIKKAMMNNLKYLVIATDNSSDQLASASDIQVMLSETRNSYAAAFNKTGTKIAYSIGGKFEVVIVDDKGQDIKNIIATSGTNQEIRVFKALCFNGNSSRLATLTQLNMVTVFNLENNSPIYSFVLPGNIVAHDMKFSDNENVLLFKSSLDDGAPATFAVDLTPITQMEKYLYYQLNEKQIKFLEQLEINVNEESNKVKPWIVIDFNDVDTYHSLKSEIKDLFELKAVVVTDN